VPGIGNGTKRRVRQALGLPDWAELAVVASNGQTTNREEK